MASVKTSDGKVLHGAAAAVYTASHGGKKRGKKKGGKKGGSKKGRRRRSSGGGAGTFKSFVWGALKLGALVGAGVVIGEGTRAYLTSDNKDGTPSWFAKQETSHPGVMGVLMTALPAALAGGAMWMIGKRFGVKVLVPLGAATAAGAVAIGGVRYVLQQPAVAVRTRLVFRDKTPAELAAQKAAVAQTQQSGNGLLAPGGAAPATPDAAPTGLGALPMFPQYDMGNLRDNLVDKPGPSFAERRAGMGDSFTANPYGRAMGGYDSARDLKGV